MPDCTCNDAPDETAIALDAIAESSPLTISADALDDLPKQPRMSPQERPIVVDKSSRRFSSATLRSDSTALVRRDRDGVSENELTSEEAVRQARDLRGKALKTTLPDSTPAIRTDRNSR